MALARLRASWRLAHRLDLPARKLGRALSTQNVPVAGTSEKDRIGPNGSHGKPVKQKPHGIAQQSQRLERFPPPPTENLCYTYLDAMRRKPQQHPISEAIPNTRRAEETKPVPMGPAMPETPPQAAIDAIVGKRLPDDHPLIRCAHAIYRNIRCALSMGESVIGKTQTTPQGEENAGG